MSMEITNGFGLQNESFSASFVDEIIQRELANTDHSKKTKIRRRIIMFCIVFCTIASFSCGGILFYFFCLPVSSKEICLTENCVIAAAQIISYMNTSVDPCENFYEFACGQWIKDQVVKPGQGKIDMETIVTDGLMERLKYLLSLYVDDEPKYMRRVKIFYQFCLTNVVELSTPSENKDSTQKPKLIRSSDDDGGEDHEKKCVETTKVIFKEAVSRLYVDEYFKEDDREYVKEMFADIAEAFTNLLNKNTWMSNANIKKSIKTLKEMKAKIGYPEYLMDNERLKVMYGDFGEDDGYTEYLQAMENFNKGNIKLMSKSLNEWTEEIAGLDALYNRHDNYFVLPAGFMQPWVYSKTYTRTMNFGKIGMIMAHEVIHGFDSEYFIRPMDENETEPIEADLSNFGTRKKCILNQYAGLVWKQQKISSLQTITENLADIIGLKLSYMAYTKSMSKKKEEQLTLPGLAFNHKQIFFISFAQMWCDKVADSEINTRIRNDVHAPNVFRVNGPVQNLPEFAELFHCPLGSPMNPPIKCTIY